MAKEGQNAQLEGIAGALKAAGGRGPPPVHLWNPPYCGEIDMRIAADGTWFYQKTPIGRATLVKLFASVLKREGERYFLVTPVEKCGITVDEALRVLTINGAYASHEDSIKGSISAGKLADFVVLAEDPHSGPQDKIKDIAIVRTVTGGSTVYQA